MLTLALDCSTARGSAAIGLASGGVLWERCFPAGRGHGGELFTTLQEGLRATVTPPERTLGRIVVGLGPGSYSGVRQAIAVATGLSLATGATLAGATSTLALDTRAAHYHAIGDARRGTFYHTAVSRGRLLTGPELVDDEAALLARFAAHPDWPVLAMEMVPEGIVAQVCFPLATRLLEVAPLLQQSGILEPIYLRPPSVTPSKAELGRRKAESSG